MGTILLIGTYPKTTVAGFIWNRKYISSICVVHNVYSMKTKWVQTLGNKIRKKKQIIFN